MRRILLKVLRRRRLERDLEAELAFHRELASQAGNPIALGSTIRIKEQTRDLWRFRVLEDVWRDLLYGARGLVRQPGFTVFALVALVLGIGLNVAIFGAFNQMMLRPWAVHEPGRIAIGLGEAFSVADIQRIREQARSFEGVTATSAFVGSVAVDGQRRSADFVGWNYFDVLAVPMAFGRPFRASDDRFEAPEPVVVIAHAFWASQYGGDRDVVGRKLDVNGVPFTVIGVASREFTGGQFAKDLWLPVASRSLVHPQDRVETGVDARCCNLLARLAKGVSRTEGEAELAVIARRLPPQPSGLVRPVRLVGTRFVDRAGWGGVFPYFLIAQLAVGAILLMACTNVGNLVLARAIARDRELAVRMSLGAGRGRIVRQLLAEVFLFASVATLVTLLIAFGLAQVDRLSGRTVSVAADGTSVTNVPLVGIDVGVIAYAAGMALLAMLVCGLVPALQATRADLIDAVKRQSAQATPYLPLRGVLLAAQVAISVTLLVCAALLIRGVLRASSEDVGFKAHGVAAVSVRLRWEEFNGRGTNDIVARLRNALRPFGPLGVAAAVPLLPSRDTVVVVAPTNAGGEERASVAEQVVDAGYFDVLGIPLLAGRNFAPRDRDRDVVIVNESLARRFWSGAPPVGRSIELPTQPVPTFEASPAGFRLAPPGKRPHEIIGVVRDAHLAGLKDVAPTVFRLHMETDQSFTLLVSERVAATTAAAVSRFASGASVGVSRLGDMLDAELRGARTLAGLASGLGVIALLLAATGVYGVIAYAVEGSRREIGIRMALGATARTVIEVVIGRNARAMGVGLAIGLLMATLVSKVLESQLYGVSRLDPAAYGGVILLLLASALAASALPARRAVCIDPVKMLNTD